MLPKLSPVEKVEIIKTLMDFGFILTPEEYVDFLNLTPDEFLAKQELLKTSLGKELF